MHNKIKLEDLLDYKNLIRLKIFRVKLAILHGKLETQKGEKKIAELKQRFHLTDA